MIPLFTAVFLVFMAGGGEKVATVRAKQALPEEACCEFVKQQTPVVEAFVSANKGFPVFAIGACVPEERRT